jgi:chemotaxis protein MotB
MAVPKKPAESDEFLWLMSLSDLMILLFIFFVVLFSFAQTKLKDTDFQRIVATLRNEKDPLQTIQENLSKWSKNQKLDEQVSVSIKDDAVVVEIKDKILFPSGKALLHPVGIGVMQKLAKVLENVPAPYRIGIEGHTDDIPIHTRDIQDNWDLSAKRSLAVLKTMGLRKTTLTRTLLMAYGEMNPLVPNRKPNGVPIPENQAKNRRVTVRIF